MDFCNVLYFVLAFIVCFLVVVVVVVVDDVVVVVGLLLLLFCYFWVCWFFKNVHGLACWTEAEPRCLNSLSYNKCDVLEVASVV